MSVSTAVAVYEIRIATAGAATVDGNVELALAVSDISDIPVVQGPSVDLMGATTTSHPFELKCIVDTVLFTSGGRLTELGRLVEIRRALDGGAATAIATGRMSGASEVERGLVTLYISDERWVERDTEIFRTTDTIQLHPHGFASAWRNYPAAGTATYEVKAISGDAVRIGASDERTESDIFRRYIPLGIRRALATDLVPPEDRDGSASNSDGNFVSLAFRESSVDYPVISFRPALGGAAGGTTHTGLLGRLSPDGGDGSLTDAWVYIAGHALSVGNTLTGRFYWPGGVAINEDMPLHLGGAAGLHPMVLAQDILDGDHGGQAVRYDAAAMAAVQALPMRPVWARITGPADRARWLEENVYRAFAVAPLVGTDLNLRPTSLRLPQGLDPGTLDLLSAANSTLFDWEHTSRDLVTAVEYTARGVRQIAEDDRGGDETADGLETYEELRRHTHDNVATLGEKKHVINTELIFDTTGIDTLLRESHAVAVELFDVFGDGAQHGEITVPDNLGLEVGDYVLLDHDTIQGYNVGTAGRTGDRLVLLTGFSELQPDRVRFGYLDVGPDSQPLTAPTVSIIQNVTDPDLVDVTISGLAAGSLAHVEVASGTSEPTQFDLVRVDIGNETISFRLEAASGNAYAKAYAYAPHRTRSAWSTTASVALTARAMIVTADVRIRGTIVEVTWEVAAGTGGMRTDWDAHTREEVATLGSNQQDYDATDGGFTIPKVWLSRSMVTVQLTPYPGFSGGAVTGTPGAPLTLTREFTPTVIFPMRPQVRIVDARVDWLPSGLAAGGLRLRINTDGAGFVRYLVSTSAFPTEANVDASTAAAVNADGYLEDSFAGPYDLGADVFVSLKAYEFDTGDTDESELVTLKVTRPAMTEPRVQADWVRVSSTTAALDLTIDDPTLSVEAVRFNKREGSESGDTFTGWQTTWDRSTGTIGASATLTRGEDVSVEEGQESIIRWEVDFQDENGTTQTIAGAHSSANQDEHATTLTVPASDMDPQDEGESFARTTNGLMHPNVVGSPQTYHKGLVLPAGVEVTNISARMSRAAAGDTAQTILYRNTPSQSTLATLTHSTIGEATVSSGAISETVASDGSYSIRTTLESASLVNDAYIRWVSVTYTRHHQNEKY